MGWWKAPSLPCSIDVILNLESPRCVVFYTFSYLGNQISPKSEDFCIWRHFVPWLPWQRPPFWIFSASQKLPHTTVDIPTKWIIIWLPNNGYQFPTSKSTWKPNFAQIREKNSSLLSAWRHSWQVWGRGQEGRNIKRRIERMEGEW